MAYNYSKMINEIELSLNKKIYDQIMRDLDHGMKNNNLRRLDRSFINLIISINKKKIEDIVQYIIQDYTSKSSIEELFDVDLTDEWISVVEYTDNFFTYKIDNLKEIEKLFLNDTKIPSELADNLNL